MIRPVPMIAGQLIERLEACRKTAYKDGRGIWTIGVGHTGPEVVEGLVWTQLQCDQALLDDMTTAAGRLALVLHPDVIAALDEHQYAALISFVFNLGEKPEWTIWKLLNLHAPDVQICAQIMRFDKMVKDGALVVVPGLDNRRRAEVTFWNTADIAQVPALAATSVTPPSSEIRDAVTPPTPNVVKPLPQSKSFVTAVVTATTGVASVAIPLVQNASGGVKQVSDALQPFADAVPLVGKIQTALAMAMAGGAVAVVVLLWIKNHQAKTQ